MAGGGGSSDSSDAQIWSLAAAEQSVQQYMESSVGSALEPALDSCDPEEWEGTLIMTGTAFHLLSQEQLVRK